MAQVTLNICDRCDKRDNTEHPPIHGICQVAIQVRGTPRAYELYSRNAWLCTECVDIVKSKITELTNQAPARTI